MYSVIRKYGLNLILDCPSRNCPVKHPEICPINFPMPCPNIAHANQKNSEQKEKENDKLLGRWKPENDFKKTAMKVDYANVDHCGPCGSDDVRNITNVYRKPTVSPYAPSLIIKEELRS
jgi:hypothetical protein